MQNHIQSGVKFWKIISQKLQIKSGWVMDENCIVLNVETRNNNARIEKSAELWLLSKVEGKHPKEHIQSLLVAFKSHSILTWKKNSKTSTNTWKRWYINVLHD